MRETCSLLITDDDRDFRETLQSLFETRGFETLLAGDGEEALTIVQSRPVHVLLLDMHMPRMSGLDTIRQLKKMHYSLPCILISGALDEEIERSARQADAFSVLRKPVPFDVVTGTVRQALRQFYDLTWPE